MYLKNQVFFIVRKTLHSNYRKSPIMKIFYILNKTMIKLSY